MGKNIFLMLIFISILIFGCKRQNKIHKEIAVLIGCDNIEVINDINYSLKEISDYLKINNIKVIVNKNTKDCGYILRFKSKFLKIESAMTDIDLLETCKKFFN